METKIIKVTDKGQISLPTAIRQSLCINQGDDLLVPFPFSDLSSIKQRPVLVLSKKQDNINCDDIITCGITSNLKDIKHSVIIENSNLINGKIPAKSRIKRDKLFTLSKDIIRKKVERINKETFEKVKIEFHSLL
jgi:mRNA interferase MazF